MGYGFVNFLNTTYLELFYNQFQNKRWTSKFRSEKVPFP